jgi:hypothetical protein
MKRICIAALLTLATALAAAAPTLTTNNAYDAATGLPSSAWVMVNGTTRVECTLVANANRQVVPTCDLASLVRPGTYTLELFVSNETSMCAPDAGTAPAWTCSSGGTASTGPFSLKLLPGGVSRPVVRLVP